MVSQSRIIVLCESYPIDYLLYKLENEKIDVPVTVFVTALSNLYQLLKLLNEKVYNNSLDLIYYPAYAAKWREARGIKKWLYLLPDILRERRHLKRFYHRHFARMKGATVIFPSPGYTGIKIYVLTRLSKKNRLVFLDPGPPYMGKKSPRNLREIATLLMYKIAYGKDTQLGQYPAVDPWSKNFPLIPDSFIKNSVDDVIDWSNKAEKMKDFEWDRYRIYDTGDIKVIYFHQDLVGLYVPDRNTFKRELNDIFNAVLRHFPEKEIARKYHPGHDLNKDVIEVGEELPSYIPAQFLHSEKVQIYLGISSSSIVDVKDGQAISIMELLSFTDENIKKQSKEMLVNVSRSEILFPKTLDELDNMLLNVKKREH